MKTPFVPLVLFFTIFVLATSPAIAAPAFNQHIGIVRTGRRIVNTAIDYALLGLLISFLTPAGSIGKVAETVKDLIDDL